VPDDPGMRERARKLAHKIRTMDQGYVTLDEATEKAHKALAHEIRRCAIVARDYHNGERVLREHSRKIADEILALLSEEPKP